MDLGDILSKEQIITDLQAADRWLAIDELINLLVATGKIKPENKDAISAVVKKRETSMSTGIGFGIGIPHASRRASFKNISIRSPTLPSSCTKLNFARRSNSLPTRRPCSKSSASTGRNSW